MFKKTISISLIIALLLPPTVALSQQQENEKKKIDYYFEGREKAERDYEGAEAFLAGFATGLLGSFLGWGVGYVIVKNMRADMPMRYRRDVIDLDREQRFDFEDGYTDYVRKARAERFGVGAGIGTLVWVLVYFSVTD